MTENNYNSKNLEGKVASPYTSVGETIISEILQKYQINFKYQKPQVDDKLAKVKGKYQDFYLKDLGVVLEYAGGNVNDPNYIRGLEEKAAKYKKMGLRLIVIKPEEIFFKAKDGTYHKRPDFEEYLKYKIQEAVPKSAGAKKGNLESSLGYEYRQAA